MPTLDPTVGGADSNSYATTSEADTYFTERMRSSAWSDEDTDDKERALISASRRIDEEDFMGSPAAETQALKWPREGVTLDHVVISSSVIPEIIKRATYELALQVLIGDDDSEDFLADSGLEAFKNVKVGPIDVTPRFGHGGGELPSNVERILEPVLETAGYSAKMLRA